MNRDDSDHATDEDPGAYLLNHWHRLTLYVLMSIIHTSELCGVNRFVYLTQLQRHAGELKQNPSQWMPWNYRDTLERAGASTNSG